MASETTSKSESKRTSKSKSTPENSSTTKEKKATATKASKKDSASADQATTESKKTGGKSKAASATATKADASTKSAAKEKKTTTTDKPTATKAKAKSEEKAVAKETDTSAKKAGKTASGKKSSTASGDNFEQFILSVRGIITAANEQERDLNALAELITARAEAGTQTGTTKKAAAKGKKSNSQTDKKKSALEAAILFTSPGLPLLFLSDELDAGSEMASHTGIGTSAESGTAGMLTLLQDLAALSRNQHGTTRGLTGQNVNVFHINNHDKVLAYHRYSEGGSGDSTVVLVNLSGQSFNSYSIGLPEDGMWKVRFNSDWKGYDEEFGGQESYDAGAVSGGLDNMNFQGHFGLGAYSTVILSLE